MKVTLKNIKFNERMSEETNCFTADLYINGKNVGFCQNHGHGGCTDYRGESKEDNAIIRQAEDYFKSLPKVKPEGYNFELQPTLEGAIDDQLEAYLKAKEEKKMQKMMANAILWGRPNGGSYTYIKFKAPLSVLAQSHKAIIQAKIMEIQVNKCKNGIKILNTNLEALGFQL